MTVICGKGIAYEGKKNVDTQNDLIPLEFLEHKHIHWERLWSNKLQPGFDNELVYTSKGKQQTPI